MSVAYYDQRWKVENKLDSPPAPERMNQITKLLNSVPKVSHTQRLIDIGCGNGWVLQEIEKRHSSNFHYFGLEPSPTGVANSYKRVPSAMIFEQTLEDFVCDTPFDIVICSEVIEHVEEAQQFLSRIHDLLTADGIAILTTPNGDFRPRFFKDNPAACEQPIENWLTPKELRRACQNHFRIQSLDTFQTQFYFRTHPFLKSIRSTIEKMPFGKQIRRVVDRFLCQILHRGLYIRAVLQRKE